MVKNGLRLCGTGSARGSAPILQDKVEMSPSPWLLLNIQAYWEVKVQQGGKWSVGIATPAADLTKVSISHLTKVSPGMSIKIRY